MSARGSRRSSAPVTSEGPNPLLSPSDLAWRLSVTRSMAYKLLKTGQLRATYVGCLPRTTEEELVDYLERQKAPTPALMADGTERLRSERRRSDGAGANGDGE